MVSATPGDDDGGDSAAVDHSSGMVAGQADLVSHPGDDGADLG
jgi:hypothetical protein